MKQYQSTIEGTWIEFKQVQLTEEQQTLLMSKEESDKEAKRELAAQIKSQREGAVSKTETAKLVAFYNSKKPALKETDTYQLIAVNLSGIDGNYKGIINCLVNGEHVQVRF